MWRIQDAVVAPEAKAQLSWVALEPTGNMRLTR